MAPFIGCFDALTCSGLGNDWIVVVLLRPGARGSHAGGCRAAPGADVINRIDVVVCCNFRVCATTSSTQWARLALVMVKTASLLLDDVERWKASGRLVVAIMLLEDEDRENACG